MMSSDPKSDIRNLRIRLRKAEDRLTKAVEIGFQLADYRAPSCIYPMMFRERLLRYQLKTMLQEYAFLENDTDALITLYQVAKPEEKNLLAEAFMIGFLAPKELTFPVNMVMGSVHIRAFMSTLQVERWRGEQTIKYQNLLKEAPYEIRRNPGDWEVPPLNLEQAFKELHEYFLKEFSGPEAYVEKNRVDVLGNKIKVFGHQWIGFLYFPSPVLQPFLKDIGENSPIYKTGWIGIPHNSEAIRGELPGG
eukprot:Gb_16818 [translate_table: standard]